MKPGRKVSLMSSLYLLTEILNPLSPHRYLQGKAIILKASIKSMAQVKNERREACSLLKYPLARGLLLNLR